MRERERERERARERERERGRLMRVISKEMVEPSTRVRRLNVPSG